MEDKPKDSDDPAPYEYDHDTYSLYGDVDPYKLKADIPKKPFFDTLSTRSQVRK